jgi:hypothetical protein
LFILFGLSFFHFPKEITAVECLYLYKY